MGGNHKGTWLTAKNVRRRSATLTPTRTRPRLFIAGALATIALSSAASADVGVSLLPLPANWQGSAAAGISADGSTVVGQTAVVVSQGQPPVPRAARWVLGGSAQDLGAFPAQNFPRALGASASGQVVFGVNRTPQFFDHGFVWRQSTGLQMLQIPQGYQSARPFGIAPDGSLVYGTLSGSGASNRAASWTASGAAELLPLPEGAGAGTVGAVAGNGAVIGTAGFPGPHRLIRWVAGVPEYMTAEPFPHEVAPRAASFDASVVAGLAQVSAFDYHPWRWTSAGGTEILPMLPGMTVGHVAAMSADASILVGDNQTSDGIATAVATVWLADGSVRTLSAHLAAAGLDTTGWTFRTASGISADGRIIVGTAEDPFGGSGGFVAVVPAPATGLLGLAGLVAAGRRRRN